MLHTRREILIPLLFISCFSGSVLTVDVVGATPDRQQQLTEAAYILSTFLSRDYRSYPSVVMLKFHPLKWSGRASGIILAIVPWLPEDDVGEQIGSERKSTVLLWDGLDKDEFAEVFVHEIGHVLGISHSSYKTDIMWENGNGRNLNEIALRRFKKSIPRCP